MPAAFDSSGKAGKGQVGEYWARKLASKLAFSMGRDKCFPGNEGITRGEASCQISSVRSFLCLLSVVAAPIASPGRGTRSSALHALVFAEHIGSTNRVECRGRTDLALQVSHLHTPWAWLLGQGWGP